MFVTPKCLFHFFLSILFFFSSPSQVLAAVMVCLNKDTSWASASKEMADPNFITRLKTFRAEEMTTNVSPPPLEFCSARSPFFTPTIMLFFVCVAALARQTLKAITKRIQDEEFTFENVKSKSIAAAVMCTWCIAMQKYVTGVFSPL